MKPPKSDDRPQFERGHVITAEALNRLADKASDVSRHFNAQRATTFERAAPRWVIVTGYTPDKQRLKVKDIDNACAGVGDEYEVKPLTTIGTIALTETVNGVEEAWTVPPLPVGAVIPIRWRRWWSSKVADGDEAYYTDFVVTPFCSYQPPPGVRQGGGRINPVQEV